MSYKQYVDKGKNQDIKQLIIPELVDVIFNRSETIGSAFVERDRRGILADIHLKQVPSNSELWPAIIVQNNRLVSISLNPERNADRTIKPVQWITNEVIEEAKLDENLVPILEEE